MPPRRTRKSDRPSRASDRTVVRQPRSEQQRLRSQRSRLSPTATSSILPAPNPAQIYLGLTVGASVQGKNYALDNRFHRTDLPLSRERPPRANISDSWRLAKREARKRRASIRPLNGC